MSDPQRLLGGDSTSEFEKSVLSSWEGRQPSDAARARTLVTVATFAAVTAVGAGAALSPGMAAGMAAGTSSVAPKAIVASSALLKWLALGAALATTAGAVGYAVQRSTLAALPPASESVATVPLPARGFTADPPRGGSGDPSRAVPAQRAAARSAEASEGWRELPQASPAGPLDHVPPGHVPDAAESPPRGAPGVAPPQAGSTLDDEVYAIDQARRAVIAGNAAAALGLVDGYDARFPGGALAQESTEVRIEALYRLGRRPQADKLGARFLAAHPTSPYAREVRALAAANPSAPRQATP